jgi:Transposase DDE domain
MTVSQTPLPVQMDELDETLKMLFSDIACQLGRSTGFVKRQSKITGAVFAQALVFGFLINPDASYTDLQHTVAMQGVKVSPQALEQRISETAALFLLRFLERVVAANIAEEPVAIELLSRFHGVYLQDGSILGLPGELEPEWQGFGGNTEESGRSALRIQVRLNLHTGRIQGPWLQSATTHERTGISSFEETPVPEGSLSIIDSGHFTIPRMKQFDEQKKYWLTHAKASLQIIDVRGVKQSIPEMLMRRKSEVIDEEVIVGAKNGLKCRFIAFRVSEEIEKKRRESVNTNTKKKAKGSRGDVGVRKSKKKGTKKTAKRVKMGKKRLELCGWTILLTNVPVSILSAVEARILMRARWQIELLWKLWKQHGLIDIWRSAKKYRILCEIYAKLIAQVIQHWLIVDGCWKQPHRSQVKAQKAVQKLGACLLLFLQGKFLFCEIRKINGDMMEYSRVNKRSKHPSTSQRLLSPQKTAA